MTISITPTKLATYGLLAAVLVAPSAVLATEEELAPGFNACMQRGYSTANMVECYNSAYEYWDKILNKNYKKAMKNCDEDGTPECKANLKKAQIAWIQYKEIMSAFISSSSDGTISRVNTISFLAEETKKQAKLLNTDEY